MLEYHKETCELLFNSFVMKLAEMGTIDPIYIMILDGQVIPILISNGDGMSFDNYKILVSKKVIEIQPEALILIFENWQVSREKGDSDIDLLAKGLMKPSEQEDKELWLSLIYSHIDDHIESLIGKIETDIIGTKFVREQKWVDECVSNLILPWKM